MFPISSQTEEIGPASDGETIKMPITALRQLAQTNFKINFFLPASTKMSVERKEVSRSATGDLLFPRFFANTGGIFCFHVFLQTQVSNPWRRTTFYR